MNSAKSGARLAGAIQSINQPAGFPELYRQEVSRAHTDRSPFNAASVSAAVEYLIAPEVEAGFIRFTTEEVEIVLPHKVLRGIQWM